MWSRESPTVTGDRALLSHRSRPTQAGPAPTGRVCFPGGPRPGALLAQEEQACPDLLHPGPQGHTQQEPLVLRHWEPCSLLA